MPRPPAFSEKGGPKSTSTPWWSPSHSLLHLNHPHCPYPVNRRSTRYPPLVCLSHRQWSPCPPFPSPPLLASNHHQSLPDILWIHEYLCPLLRPWGYVGVSPGPRFLHILCDLGIDTTYTKVGPLWPSQHLLSVESVDSGNFEFKKKKVLSPVYIFASIPLPVFSFNTIEWEFQ